MPKITIYIRIKDLAKWIAIKDKPAWLHERLNQQGEPVYPLDDVHPGQLHYIPHSIKTCKHGADIQFCKCGSITI